MRYFAVKKYVRKLYPTMVQRYGRSESYTQGQIITTVTKLKFSNKHLPYALGLYLASAELPDALKSIDSTLIANEVREYLANRFFNGDINFTIKQSLHGSPLINYGNDSTE